MPDERENAEAQLPADEAEENDRPTVSPPFDPAELARDLLKTAPPPADAPSPKGAFTRATPPGGTDDQGSAATFRPAPRTSGTPEAAAPKPGFESVSRLAVGVDREWAELELATRPPPAPASPPEEADPLAGLVVEAPLNVEMPVESSAETLRRPEAAAAAAASAAAPATPAAPPKSRSREMNDLVELGDYSGALEIAEEILREKSNDIGAKTVAETCRTVLRQMYATRIGPLERVPVVMVPRDQLRWLSIDHRAGFVLSLVDGVSSLEMIIDVSGMPELDTLRILSELAQQRIISLR